METNKKKKSEIREDVTLRDDGMPTGVTRTNDELNSFSLGSRVIMTQRKMKSNWNFLGITI